MNLKKIIDYDKRKIFKHKLTVLLVLTLLIIFGYTYIGPILYAFATSIKSLDDITNPFVTWIATDPTLQNYSDILGNIDIGKVLLYTIAYAGISSLLQTISCAVIGYGFANYEFRFKKLFLIILLIVFILPDQVTMTPTYVLFGKLGITNSMLSFWVPAILGQGINSSIFILIFYNYFKSIPKELYESAKMEGARSLTIFRKVTLPLVAGAINITFILSFVWYWNETYLTQVFYRDIPTYTLKLQGSLAALQAQSVDAQMQMTQFPIYDGLKGATIILMILPLIAIYFAFQRRFTQSIENDGLTGQ